MKKNNVANHERHELHHNELTTKTKKSMLVRIISAVVLICLVVPAIILGDWIYFILMSLALCFACYEILGCAGKRTVFIYIVYVIFVSLIAFWPMFREIVKNSASFNRPDAYYGEILLPILPVVLGFFFMFWLTVIYKDFSVVDASFLITMGILLGFGFQCLFYLRYFTLVNSRLQTIN